MRALCVRMVEHRLVYLLIAQISIFSINYFTDSVHVPIRLNLIPLLQK
jgi:hypothetical protein